MKFKMSSLNRKTAKLREKARAKSKSNLIELKVISTRFLKIHIKPATMKMTVVRTSFRLRDYTVTVV